MIVYGHVHLMQVRVGAGELSEGLHRVRQSFFVVLVSDECLVITRTAGVNGSTTVPCCPGTPPKLSWSA